MQYRISLAAILAGTTIVAAAPRSGVPRFHKRQAYSNFTDTDILNYALTLEHLEDKFYREGLSNYTEEQFASAGFGSDFYRNLREVSSDESTHVEFLANALGSNAVAECTYSFPSTDPQSFVALAAVLEGVGVSAYLGAAASIQSKEYLTAAGSILTVEARHSAYLRTALGESPFPTPFDIPLSFNEVYTLAAPFIVVCPSSNPTIPVRSFPRLELGSEAPVSTGETITLLTPGYTIQANETQLYGAFVTVMGPIFEKATAVDGGFEVTVPANIAGQNYVVLTPSSSIVNDGTVVAGPAIVEVDGQIV